MRTDLHGDTRLDAVGLTRCTTSTAWRGTQAHGYGADCRHQSFGRMVSPVARQQRWRRCSDLHDRRLAQIALTSGGPKGWTVAQLPASHTDASATYGALTAPDPRVRRAALMIDVEGLAPETITRRVLTNSDVINLLSARDFPAVTIPPERPLAARSSGDVVAHPIVGLVRAAAGLSRT